MPILSSLRTMFLYFAAFLAGTMAWNLPTSANAEIRIGLSLPFAADAAPLARQFEIGAEKAIETFNAEADQEAVLIKVDDGCDEEIATLAADDLLNLGTDVVIGLICNEPVYEIADRLSAENIPLIVSGARSVRILKDRKRRQWNVWQVVPDDTEAARFAAEVLSSRWADIPYAIVDDGTVLGRNLADAFRAEMEAIGLPPQFQDVYRPTQSTQARLVRRLRRAGTSHVFIGGSADDIALIARNAADMDIPLTIAGGEELGIFPYLIEEEQPPAGLLAILPGNPAMINKPIATDTTDIDETLASLGPSPYELRGQQAAEIALAAIQRMPDQPSDALENGEFDTVLGSVRFSTDGDNTVPYYALYRWDGSAFVPVRDGS